MTLEASIYYFLKFGRKLHVSNEPRGKIVSHSRARTHTPTRRSQEAFNDLLFSPLTIGGNYTTNSKSHNESHYTHLTHAHTHLILPELVHLQGFTKKGVTMETTTKASNKTSFQRFSDFFQTNLIRTGGGARAEGAGSGHHREAQNITSYRNHPLPTGSV